MKALIYHQAHDLENFSIEEAELPEPTLRDHDVLVRVGALAVNPVDYKVRRSRSAQDGRPVVLGWDAAGVIERVGAKVSNFNVGDEVFYAGDLNRDGSYAERQAVDARIIAHKPQTISLAEAAALPLTALTAYEALILQTTTRYTPETKVLVIGGAGGVGSIGIQLLKALTSARIVATASREESKAWCLGLGADDVIDHRRDLAEESRRIGIPEFDLVFGTNHSDRYLPVLPKIIRPFGHFALIDGVASLDIKSFMSKSITTSWELMFTKTMYDYDLESQGRLLAHVAELIDGGKIRTTANTVYEGLTAENIKRAHQTLESGTGIGKTVITV